jgi:hypothetical protein
MCLITVTCIFKRYATETHSLCDSDTKPALVKCARPMNILQTNQLITKAPSVVLRLIRFIIYAMPIIDGQIIKTH